MPQSQTIEAIYENGVLRPLEALEGLAEHAKVKITVEKEETTLHPLLRFERIIEGEFEMWLMAQRGISR
jgi:predicted DNA-binding antitoxin AbrB/MazE fold protein